MRHVRRFAVPLFVAAVVLASCSGGSGKGLQINDSGTNTTVASSDSGPPDTGSTDTGSTDAVGTAHVPTKSELESALLTTDDLPSGFTEDRSGDDDDTSDVHADDADCEALLQELQDSANERPEVTAAFANGSTQFVTHALSASDDGDELGQHLTALKRVCGSDFKIHGDGFTSGMFKPLDDPGIGDYSALIAVTFSGETQGTKFTAVGYVVLVQRGPVSSTIEATAISAPDAGIKGDPPTKADALALAQRADEHVQELVG